MPEGGRGRARTLRGGVGGRRGGQRRHEVTARLDENMLLAGGPQDQVCDRHPDGPEDDDDPLWHWRQYIDSPSPTPWWVLDKIKTEIDLVKRHRRGERVVREIRVMEEVRQRREVEDREVCSVQCR